METRVSLTRKQRRERKAFLAQRRREVNGTSQVRRPKGMTYMDVLELVLGGKR